VFRFVGRNRLTASVATLLLLLAGFIGWNLLDPGTDPRIEAMRRKGYPVNLAELDAWYKAVPVSENVALAYGNAFQALLIPGDPAGELRDKKARLRRRQGLSAEERRGLAGLVVTNETVLDMLQAVPASGRSRYPIDLKQGFSTLLPHLAKVKQATAVLCAQALLQAGDGENEQAVKSVAAAARVADSLSQEPIVISQLVRAACWESVLLACEQMLGCTRLTEEQLASLQQMMNGAENPEALARGLAGEQAFGIAVFSDPKEEAGLFAGSYGTPAAQGDRMRANLFVGLAKASGVFKKDRAFYLALMATNIAAAELPYPQRLEVSRQAASVAAPGRLLVVSSMLLPALAKAVIRDADQVAHLRAARAALAVERFRRTHDGMPPESLEALVPSLLATVPADPYDGKPLRFKKLEPGYVVYSIGSDGQDDGGAELDPKNRNAGHDITFTVER
jgi:hypothetical protein